MARNSKSANTEKQRLEEDRRGKQPWRLWGPYLSERQWGTVREDYSADGDAWAYFTYDHSKSRAYRWGEDGIAGICDDHQHLCLALALWNERDPHLKERLFGLSNHQGNHGEDVKELYYYLDATPTHSYLKALYKYPQREFPYAQLVQENAHRNRHLPEFELLDTGIFDDDRYFDVFVEYAKLSPTDLLVSITAFNRGPDEAALHILPHLWFRNTWSWTEGAAKPSLSATPAGAIDARDPKLGTYLLYAEDDPELLFCENETNARRLFDANGAQGSFKDAIHDYVVGGNNGAVNPLRTGTKAALHYVRRIPAQGSTRIRLRLCDGRSRSPFASFDKLFQQRRDEADTFYADLQSQITDADARNVQRQALAGMIWGKQCYHYSVDTWLQGDPAQPPPPPQHRQIRNRDWDHLRATEVLSMPDKWEYPWFAAWDLAFHCIPLAMVDPEFAKRQLHLLTREWYMHPNGQLPAYEWQFGDVNPPVHAWAAWRVFQIDRKARGRGDVGFLERVFHKLLLNFTWWVNRKDAEGRNIFQGGFLGLDNIGVFDRSMPLPTGAHIDQSDATAWMGMFCLNLLRIALELSLHNPAYQDIATKFFEHFLAIARAMTRIGGDGHGQGLWDEQDEFYYDVLHLDGTQSKLKVRSMVGLIPLFAVETLEPELLDRLPDFKERLTWYLDNRPDLAAQVSRWQEPGRGERRLLSLLRGHRMKCLLRRILDETEFLSPHGVRALSRYHAEHPYTFWADGQPLTVAYVPGDSDSGRFGGNSNWRGPVWLPVNYLLIESLQKFHHYYTDDFKIECPTGSGQMLTIAQVAQELANRLMRLFLRDAGGRRSAFGDNVKLQTDPHFRDYLLFHEYFHGETGAGLGASHQTGWTGVIAKLLQPRRDVRREERCPNAPTFHKAARQRGKEQVGR
jgi:hypothetical protein